MDSKSNAVKYDLVTGKKVNGKLVDTKAAGYALLFEGNDYYVVKLMMWDKYYFLTKNRESTTNYTIFAKHLRNEHLFRDPVGLARLNDDLKSHLEIYFPVIGATLYMNLFPQA